MNNGQFAFFTTDAPSGGYHSVFLSPWRYYWHSFTRKLSG